MIYVKKKSWIKRKFKKFSGKIAEFSLFKSENISVLKFFKNAGIFFCFLLIILYAVYLFLFPVFVSEKNAEALLNSYLSKNSKLILDIENLSLRPNYKFDINLKADEIKLKYLQKKDFVTVKNPSIDVNLLTLFFGYIDLNKIRAQKLVVSTNFTKNKKYECFEYFSPEIFDLKSRNSKFELRNINILADSFEFRLFDENVKKNFYINANDVKFSSLPLNPFALNDYKPFLIAANGKVSSDSVKISDFNLKLEFKLNSNSMNRISSIISKLNYNPLVFADLYRFYSRADIDLKILPSEKKTTASGFIKFSDYSFSVNGMRLPKNKITLLFKGDRIFADCDFNFIKNQFIKISAKANISKNKFIEVKLNSSDINLSEFRDIAAVFYKIFNVNLNADEVSLSGLARADLYLKSDFKKITSSGKFEIINTTASHKKTGLNLKNINANINLSNNKINIPEASALLDDAKFRLTGRIDEKTNLNLKINSDLINVTSILNTFKKNPLLRAMIPVPDDYALKSGLLKISADIKGNFKTPVIKTNSEIKNLKVFVKSLKTEVLASDILIAANPDKNGINDVFVTVLNSAVKHKNYHSKVEKMKLKISQNDIKIEKTAAGIDKIEVVFEGVIKNYKTDAPEALFHASAKIPQQNPFLVIKSSVPQLAADFSVSKNKILINNCLISSGGRKIISLTGGISDFASENPVLNNIKISIDEKTAFFIPSENLSFDAKGTLYTSGKLPQPNLDGNLNLYNISSKPLNLFVGDLILNIKNSAAYFNIVHGKISGFDFDLVAQAKMLFSAKKPKILVEFAQFNSNHINLDAFEKYLQQVQKTARKNDFDIEILSLKGNIFALEAMNMLLNSVYFEGNFKNNILTLDDFGADAFNGKIKGSLNFDLNTQKTFADIILKEIGVRLLTSEVKEIKNLSIAASGKLSSLIRAEFKGLNQQEVLKTLDGYVKFNINDGELAQFAKLERFLQAGNILSQSILKLTLNSTISSISKQNTGDFKTIEGTVKIKDSNADIQYIKTQGSNMSLYLTGKFNLLTQISNITIFGRIPLSTVSVLGPIGNFSTSRIVDKMSDDAKDVIKSITVSPVEKMLSVQIPDEDILKIPPLAYGNSLPTREFTVRVLGPAGDVRSIKYFKWRARVE